MSIKINIGGKNFELSPVPLVGLAKLGNRIGLIGQEFTDDSAQALIDGVYYGIKRNHPEVEREFLEWNIDASNLKEILSAFIEVNKSTEATKPGERKARK